MAWFVNYSFVVWKYYELIELENALYGSFLYHKATVLRACYMIEQLPSAEPINNNKKSHKIRENADITTS